jgi:hypothetical protein
VKFGVTALVSLLHDVIVVVGTFAILGTFFHVEIDALFVTAMLTVIGFSVHDTIVVFDRIRENKARHLGEPFADIVNHSILQTFGRSIMTSLTVLHHAAVAVPVRRRRHQRLHPRPDRGHPSPGPYSSIFVASPLLVDWQRWEDRRRGRIAPTRAPRARRATLLIAAPAGPVAARIRSRGILTTCWSRASAGRSPSPRRRPRTSSRRRPPAPEPAHGDPPGAPWSGVDRGHRQLVRRAAARPARPEPCCPTPTACSSA